MQSSPLERAIEAAGSQSALARICGVSQPSVWAWVKSGKPLPAEHVLKVEAETGVSRYELRPDIYPLPSDDGSNLLNAGGASRKSGAVTPPMGAQA